jgi:hypothetical protein
LGQLWADDSAVQVVVEGTPAQIEQLVYSYRQQSEVFAEVNVQASRARRTGQFAREPTPIAGGPIRELEAESMAQSLRAVGKATDLSNPSYGLAWFFAPSDVSTDEALYAKRHEAKERGAAAEAGVRLGAPVEARSESAPSTRAGAAASHPEVAMIAKQLQSPPAEGRVRLKFVLRPAPAAAAEPATPEP